MTPDESRKIAIGEKVWYCSAPEAADSSAVATVTIKTLAGLELYWHADPNPSEWISHDNTERLRQLQKGSPPLYEPGPEERAALAADIMLSDPGAEDP